jgi:hypothetical protein
MLDVDSVTDYLLGHGLIDRAAIIDGELTVVSAARRNRNLRVEGPAGAGYLIKQADGLSDGAAETLRFEAAFCAFCHQEPAATAAARVVPRLRHCDPGRPLLALELVRGGAPPWGALAEPNALAPAARAVGGALATVHTTFRLPGLAEDPRLSWLPRRLPWVMMVHKPGLELLATLSPANCEVLRLLQARDGPGERLDRLRPLWQPDTVIHGDVKSDNLLHVPAAPGTGPGAGEVCLVDWEMVQVGDPAWDVAGVLQDLVLLWVNSMPLAEHVGVEELAARARQPWHDVQAALRAFWRAYERGAGLAPAAADRLLLRAVGFSAARLIQTAYEWAQSMSALPVQSVLLLQVSANLLQNPEEAQVRFYGIPQTFRA